MATPLAFNSPPPTERFLWDDLREFFTERSEMVKVSKGVETLRKITIA